MKETAELLVEIIRLEESLLVAWVRGPDVRRRWTPFEREFRTTSHRAIAASCEALAQLGLEGDLWCALTDRLLATGELERIWPLGRAPLDYSVSGVFSDDLQRWRELRALYGLVTTVQGALSGMAAGRDLGAARNAILEAAGAASVDTPPEAYSLSPGLTMAFEQVTRREPGGFFTGHAALDRLTGGLQPGHVWVLGAPTNWGKTSWLLAVADHHRSVHGRGVLIVTCEDAPLLVFTRWLALLARVRGAAARDARLSRPELERCAAQVQAHAHDRLRPILIDGRGRKVEELATDIRRLALQHQIQLVLVDYLQCIGMAKSAQDRRAEINHVARTLTDAIKTAGAAGVLASQLTGEDIRESRDVEHAAEVVLIGRKSDAGELSLFVKKNKTGPSGRVLPLDWNSEIGAFEQPKENNDDWAGYFEDA